MEKLWDGKNPMAIDCTCGGKPFVLQCDDDEQTMYHFQCRKCGEQAMKTKTIELASYAWNAIIYATKAGIYVHKPQFKAVEFPNLGKSED